MVGKVGNDALVGHSGWNTLDALGGAPHADTLVGGTETDRCLSDPGNTPTALAGTDP